MEGCLHGKGVVFVVSQASLVVGLCVYAHLFLVFICFPCKLSSFRLDLMVCGKWFVWLLFSQEAGPCGVNSLIQ